MILTTGLVAGTMALAFGTATPLQPVNIVRVDSNTTRVYVDKDTTVHLSDTDAFEIVIDNGKHVLKQGDGVKSYDIKVRRGDILNVTALGGFNSDHYKIGGVCVNVYN